MSTKNIPQIKKKSIIEQDPIDRSQISWLKHYRNRVIRCAVRIGWWMWAFWLPVQVFCFVEQDIFAVSNKIIHGIFLLIFGFWLLIRIFKYNGLLDTQYGHDLHLWLEKNYPLKWKVDSWFMAS